MKMNSLFKNFDKPLGIFLVFLGISAFTGCSNYDGTYTGESDSDALPFEIRMVIDENQVSGELITSSNSIFNLSGEVDQVGKVFLQVASNPPMSLNASILDEYATGNWKLIQFGFGGTWHAQKIETFESGTLDEFAWETGGDGEWFVTDSEPFEGSFAARSPVLGHGKSATLEIARECEEGGWIRFARKVESEPDFDYLYFYIDDELKGAWSGMLDYGQSSCAGYTASGCTGYTQTGCIGYAKSGCIGYTVSSGFHEFKWEYKKDNTISRGEDAAWIDNVQFPKIPNVGDKIPVEAEAAQQM